MRGGVNIHTPGQLSILINSDISEHRRPEDNRFNVGFRHFTFSSYVQITVVSWNIILNAKAIYFFRIGL